MAKHSQDTLVHAMSALQCAIYRKKREAEKSREFAAIGFLQKSTRDDLLEAAAHSEKSVNDLEAAYNELRAALQESESAKTVSDESKYADWYPLLRRMVMAQIKGDYEAGERFNHIMQEHGTPKSEAEFDAFMELAAKALEARS